MGRRIRLCLRDGIRQVLPAANYPIAFTLTFWLELEFAQFLGARQKFSVNVELAASSCNQVAVLGFWDQTVASFVRSSGTSELILTWDPKSKMRIVSN